MADPQLPATTFAPVLARRKELCNTIIEDAPQISVRRAPPHIPIAKVSITSPMSDDFPTPKAIQTSTTVATLCFPTEHTMSSPASSDTQSDGESLWSKRSSNVSFDSMYDLSSSESEDVPIKLSSSIKKRIAKTHRKPSLSIPSPSHWPTIEKYKATSTPLSPGITLQLSPSVLQQFQSQSLRVPSTCSAPSLDGSLTSEELAASSCPSTPDVQRQENAQWEATVQLNPSAFSVLQHISGEHDQEQETVIEVPEEAAQEMREIAESPHRFGGLQVRTNSLPAPKTADVDDEELSALSVPSPSNFFSSLDTAIARQAWTTSTPNGPTTSVAAEFYGVPFAKEDEHAALPTSTARSFYGVPWADRPDNAVEHTIIVASPVSLERSPITARRSLFQAVEAIQEVDEIDENYHFSLEQNAAANIDRTQLWLSSQKAYIDSVLSDEEAAVIDSFKDIDGAAPKTPDRATAPTTAISPSSKKSVRFVDATATANEAKTTPTKDQRQKRISPIHDGTFWEGWCYTKRSQRARDVFQHRQMRAEAEQIRRVSSVKVHADQLKGHFEISAVNRPHTSRPVSGFVDNAPALAAEDEQRRELIACALREQQALEQIQSSTWHVQAQKELNGGTLLTSPIVATFKARHDVNILDLAGQAHCSWAWDIAVTHPNATIFTTVSTDVEAHIAESSLDGPNNHTVVAAPKLWDLPFEDNYFDVISARNLYMHLRTHIPSNETADEWDLTLRECMRVLKPGGFLEFDLLDAEMMHPEAAAQALGVEFAFNLKTRGYDPCSGRSFLPRLKRAGFRNIKRAWMVLPVANAVPRWTDRGRPAPAATTTGVRIATPDAGNTSQFGSAGLETPEYYGAPVTGSTQDVRAITGLVGARSWEQWMLKVNSELGRSEERCLEGVGKALEESGQQGNAGWRCLVGWAKKSDSDQG